MEIALSGVRSSSSDSVTVKIVELWVDACNEFRRSERQEIFLEEPSPGRLARYERELKFFIRSAGTLLNMARDPDFPARQFIPELEGKLLQLESSLQMLNNPMTEAEADALIQKYFPDSPEQVSNLLPG